MRKFVVTICFAAIFALTAAAQTPDRGRGTGDLAFGRRGTYTFPSFEAFRDWMKARYDERDLEGLKLAFAEADTATKIRWVKENRGAGDHLKAWIAHIATATTARAFMVFAKSGAPIANAVSRSARSKSSSAVRAAREKEGPGAGGEDVVDAMVHQVLADGVVPVHGKRQFELCAHAIDAGNEDRLAITAHVQREQTAEAAHLAQHLGPVRRRQQAGQGRLDLVPQIDVHASASVSFLFHGAKE